MGTPALDAISARVSALKTALAEKITRGDGAGALSTSELEAAERERRGKPRGAGGSALSAISRDVRARDARPQFSVGQKVRFGSGETDVVKKVIENPDGSFSYKLVSGNTVREGALS